MKYALLIGLTCALVAFAAKESYTYNPAGRLTSVTYSDGTRVVYVYDAAGNVLSVKVERPTADTASKKPGKK